jgi:hypothetical protein
MRKYRASVAISAQRNYFVVDTMVNGFNLHRLSNGSLKRNLSTGAPTRIFPKQVAFAEGSGLIITGSDHGVAYIFDRRTGSILQELHHRGHSMIQAVTVCHPVYAVSCV